MIRTFALVMLAAGGCLEPTATPASEGVPIGVLLPYTGELATTGQNLERAVIMANEQLAAAESDPTKPPFRLIFRDSHSDGGMAGAQAVTDLLEQQQAVFILGPEEARLAGSMAGMLRDRTVAITGGAVSLDSTTGANSKWFRIVPTARRMSSLLAQKMVADHVRTLGIIYVPDDYGDAFNKLTADEFRASKGTVTMAAPLSPDIAVGDLVRKVQGTHPDAILLVAYPTAGASVIQEWAILGSNERWYLAPSLQSEVFAINVPPNLIDGSVGIAAGLPADAPNFASVFRRRWRGEDPSPNAHYYFDAMLLAGLAYRAASFRGATPTPTTLAAALVKVSGPGGVLRNWQEVAQSLLAVERGMDIDYLGASGPVDFSSDGSVPQGFLSGWTVRNGTIEYFPLTLPDQ